MSICTITVLLATVLCAVLTIAKACPLAPNCTRDQECTAYNDAKAATFFDVPIINLTITVYVEIFDAQKFCQAQLPLYCRNV